MTKRVLTALMAVALLCTMLPAMALANTGSMYVQTSNGGSVHLRKDPIAPANNVLTDVPYGAVVDGWVIFPTATGLMWPIPAGAAHGTAI